MTVEPIWSYPNTYNSTDPLKADYFAPQTWFVMGRLVHRTRLLTLISAEMPDILKPAYSFRGLSLSQRAQPYVQNWLRTRQSVSDLLHSFSIVVLKTILQSQIADGGDWNSVFSRIDVFNATRDNRGAMVAIDKETEEMDILAVPLGTLDALQAQSQEQMASVSQTPLVKLLGITPSGLKRLKRPGKFRGLLRSDPRVAGASVRRCAASGHRHPATEQARRHRHGRGFRVRSRCGNWTKPASRWCRRPKRTSTPSTCRKVSSRTKRIRQRLADDPKSQYYGLSLDPEDVPPDPPDLRR